MKRTQYLGILIGALYGIFIRILGTESLFPDFYNIYSISFIWITPIVISLIPVFISSNDLYKSKRKLFFYPLLAVLLFFLFAISSGLEDLLCILIIGAPFLIVAGIMGLLIGTIIKNNKINKKLYSIIFLPLLLNPIENLLPNAMQLYSIESSIVIEQNETVVWKNILEVPEIKNNEYKPGFFNYMGIPRPIRSELTTINNQTFRIGYFSDNLTLVESISQIDENRFVNFKMHIDKSELRNKPTDQHLLKGNYFNFENISYTLIPLSEKRTKLILNCDYKINSKMNGYANFWASRIIKDFEVRLLDALKNKIEE